MEKEEILKAIMELPRLKANNPISAMVGISVDELMSAVDRFDKIPTYDELLRENKKQKEIINKLYKKCKTKNASYDFDVWMKLNDSWKTLDDFAKHIKYNLHPIITDAYRCDIKNSINQIIEITKNDVVLKEDILEILENKGGLDTDGFMD